MRLNLFYERSINKIKQIFIAQNKKTRLIISFPFISKDQSSCNAGCQEACSWLLALPNDNPLAFYFFLSLPLVLSNDIHSFGILLALCSRLSRMKSFGQMPRHFLLTGIVNCKFLLHFFFFLDTVDNTFFTICPNQLFVFI